MEHYDVFLSHANADKNGFVQELKESFDKLGINVFYDKDSIDWGDNWKEKIYEGLENCDIAVIVISENFFGREWTEEELNVLLHRQSKAGGRLILPLLYNTTSDKVFAKYPKLKDIQFLACSDISEITIKLARVLIAEYHIKSNDNKSVDDMFDAFFSDSSLPLLIWVKRLIDNNNSFIDNYDDTFIGWEFFEYNGNRSFTFFQSDNNRYRINPKYYDSFVDYFYRKLKDQI